VGIARNKVADLETKQGALGNLESGSQPTACDHFPLAKSLMKQKWQSNWDIKDTGRFSHSILLMVRLSAWFDHWKTERITITTISRITSGHCGVRAHLRRSKIIEDAMYICLENYETTDQVIRKCLRFDQHRTQLLANLYSEGIAEETSMRDLCGQSK
jgi:hypothetical protein